MSTLSAKHKEGQEHDKTAEGKTKDPSGDFSPTDKGRKFEDLGLLGDPKFPATADALNLSTEVDDSIVAETPTTPTPENQTLEKTSTTVGGKNKDEEVFVTAEELTQADKSNSKPGVGTPQEEYEEEKERDLSPAEIDAMEDSGYLEGDSEFYENGGGWEDEVVETLPPQKENGGEMEEVVVATLPPLIIEGNDGTDEGSKGEKEGIPTIQCMAKADIGKNGNGMDESVIMAESPKGNGDGQMMNQSVVMASSPRGNGGEGNGGVKPTSYLSAVGKNEEMASSKHPSLEFLMGKMEVEIPSEPEKFQKFINDAIPVGIESLEDIMKMRVNQAITYKSDHDIRRSLVAENKNWRWQELLPLVGIRRDKQFSFLELAPRRTWVRKLIEGRDIILFGKKYRLPVKKIKIPYTYVSVGVWETKEGYEFIGRALLRAALGRDPVPGDDPLIFHTYNPDVEGGVPCPTAQVRYMLKGEVTPEALMVNGRPIKFVEVPERGGMKVPIWYSHGPYNREVPPEVTARRAATAERLKASRKIEGGEKDVKVSNAERASAKPLTMQEIFEAKRVAKTKKNKAKNARKAEKKKKMMEDENGKEDESGSVVWRAKQSEDEVEDGEIVENGNDDGNDEGNYGGGEEDANPPNDSDGSPPDSWEDEDVYGNALNEDGNGEKNLQSLGSGPQGDGDKTEEDKGEGDKNPTTSPEARKEDGVQDAPLGDAQISNSGIVCNTQGNGTEGLMESTDVRRESEKENDKVGKSDINGGKTSKKSGKGGKKPKGNGVKKKEIKKSGKTKEVDVEARYETESEDDDVVGPKRQPLNSQGEVEMSPKELSQVREELARKRRVNVYGRYDEENIFQLRSYRVDDDPIHHPKTDRRSARLYVKPPAPTPARMQKKWGDNSQPTEKEMAAEGILQYFDALDEMEQTVLSSASDPNIHSDEVMTILQGQVACNVVNRGLLLEVVGAKVAMGRILGMCKATVDDSWEQGLSRMIKVGDTHPRDVVEFMMKFLRTYGQMPSVQDLEGEKEMMKLLIAFGVVDAILQMHAKEFYYGDAKLLDIIPEKPFRLGDERLSLTDLTIKQFLEDVSIWHALKEAKVVKKYLHHFKTIRKVSHEAFGMDSHMLAYGNQIADGLNMEEVSKIRGQRVEEKLAREGLVSLRDGNPGQQ
jgi:hypothetical protein